MSLANVDPNLIAGAVTVLTTLFGYLWHKGKGEKTADLSELLDEAITHEVSDALDDGETVATIEKRLTGAALALAHKLGVKLPTQTVAVAVQWGVVEFRKRVKAREANQKAAKELPGKLDDLAKRAGFVERELGKVGPNEAIDTITPAKEAGVELLEIGPDGKLVPAK